MKAAIDRNLQFKCSCCRMGAILTTLWRLGPRNASSRVGRGFGGFPQWRPAAGYIGIDGNICVPISIALSIDGTAVYFKEVPVEEESWGSVQVWRFESGFHVGHALNKLSSLFAFFP